MPPHNTHRCSAPPQLRCPKLPYPSQALCHTWATDFPAATGSGAGSATASAPAPCASTSSGACMSTSSSSSISRGWLLLSPPPDWSCAQQLHDVGRLHMHAVHSCTALRVCSTVDVCARHGMHRARVSCCLAPTCVVMLQQLTALVLLAVHIAAAVPMPPAKHFPCAHPFILHATHTHPAAFIAEDVTQPSQFADIDQGGHL
jgi:hypothetical protein